MKKSVSAPTLDLHGFRVDEVAAAVDRFLMQAKSKGWKRIRIVTGKGTGAVQKTCVEYLRMGGYPFEFEKQEGGKVNSGVLVVFTDD